MNWAVTLLIIALIAGVLGFSGIMGMAIHIAWIPAVIAIILFVVHAITDKRVV